MSAAPSLRDRLVRGAQAQAASHAVRVVIQVAGVSVLVGSWGLRRYGDWLILAAVPNYIAFSDIGFIGAAMNEMIMAVGRNERERALHVFQAIALTLAILFAALALIVPLVASYVPLADLLNLGTLTNPSARWVLAMLAADALLEVYCGLFYGGFAAGGRYGEGGMWMSALLLAEFAGLAGAVLAGGGPVAGAAAMLIVRALGTAVMYLALHQQVPWLRFGRPRAIRPVLRQLLSPALASGAIPAAVILNIQGMVILLGVTVGPVGAAVFSTVRTMTRALNQLLGSVFAVITPEISRAWAAGDFGLVRALHRRGVQLAVWLAIPPTILLGVFGGSVLHLWTSGKVGAGGLLLYIFLVSVVVDTLWQTSLGVLYATNRHQRAAAIYFAGSIVAIGVAYPLVRLWGLDGAALALLLLELSMVVPVLRQALPMARDTVHGLLGTLLRPPIDRSALAALRGAVPAVASDEWPTDAPAPAPAQPRTVYQSPPPPPSHRRRPTVVLVSYLLGLGGTEKGLMAHALALPRDRWDVRVIGAWGLGPRAEPIQRAGIPVASADGDLGRLTDLLGDADIAHVFRPGGREPFIPAAIRAARVPVAIEHNQFGHIDPSPDAAVFACHLYVSKFCVLRYAHEAHIRPSELHARHRVQYLGLDTAALRALMPESRAAKAELGLDPDRPVVGRIGRAVDGKWRNLLVDMIPGLLELAPETQVMLVGATEAKLSRLRRLGVLDRCHILPTTIDERRLATYFAACDVFASASEIGESQGLAVCEALACGIPVVTSSTPWADNAQIELVEHGRNGYVANHPRPFAHAVAELVRNPERRDAFAREARAGAVLTDVVRQTRQLEALYEELLGGASALPSWSPGPAEVEAFADEYARRLRAEYAPLSTGEHARMRLVREAERWREVRRHVTLRTTAALSGRAVPGWVGSRDHAPASDADASEEAVSKPSSRPLVSR